MSERADAHRDAAAAHDRAANRHDDAEQFWNERGDEARAELERRNAQVQHHTI